MTDNYSNIPLAPFSEDIKKLVPSHKTPNDTMESFQQLISKYNMMERGLKNKRLRLSSYMVDLQKSIEAINSLSMASKIRYEIGDTLYANATLSTQDKSIGLWLGAGIMLDFEREDGINFLLEKMEERKKEMQHCEHDLSFIRKQITTMEVNISRLYNEFVKR